MLEELIKRIRDMRMAAGGLLSSSTSEGQTMSD
jgi:hypothetical protein